MRLFRERHRCTWEPLAAQVEHVYETWGGCRSEHPQRILTNVLERCSGCRDLRRSVLPGAWTWEQITRP